MNRFFMIIPVLFAVVFSADANGFEIEVTYVERGDWSWNRKTHTDIAAGSGSDSDWETWKNNKMASGLYKNIVIHNITKQADVYMGNGYFSNLSSCRDKEKACGSYQRCLDGDGSIIYDENGYHPLTPEQCESEFSDVAPYCGYNACHSVPSTDPYDDREFFKAEAACEYTISEKLSYNPYSELSSRLAELAECLSSHTEAECIAQLGGGGTEWDTYYKPYYNMSYQQYQDSLYRKVYKPCDTARDEASINFYNRCCRDSCLTDSDENRGFVYEAGCKAEAARKGQSPAEVCHHINHPTCSYYYCDPIDHIWINGKCYSKSKIKGDCPFPLKKSDDGFSCME